jgi:hypothetical protein
MRLLARAAVDVALLALGAGTAVATIAVHEIGWWGLPLSLLATALTLVALPPGWWSRLPFAAAWGCMIGWLATPRREGDYLVSADWRGYSVLGAALLVLILGIATLPRPGSRRRSGSRRSRSAATPAGEPRTAAPEI